MSHFKLIAVGFKDDDELNAAMEPYDENRPGPPRISVTKEEILERGRKTYAMRCEIIAAYERDPVAAVKKYGEYAKNIYKKKDYPNEWSNISDPNEFYKRYIEGEIVDENGNLMTTYNEHARWDYYSVEKETTIGELKKMKENHVKNFDPTPFERLWDIIVNHKEPETHEIMALWGQPNRESMLQMYQTKNNYIESMKQSFSLSYCVLTNTGWHGPGTVGMFAISTATPEQEKEFRENYYDKFIEPYPDDTPVTFIDCHI